MRCRSSAGRARDLDVVSRPEAAIGHLHDPRIGIGRRGARRLRLFAVAALLLALLALLLDLAKRRLCRFQSFDALAGGALAGSLDALVAGVGVGIDLALELIHNGLGSGKVIL